MEASKEKQIDGVIWPYSLLLSNSIAVKKANKESQAYRTLFETFRSGKTKRKEWRRRQLRQVWWLIEDNREQICDALYHDLHKHRFESVLADISATQDEVEHMYKNLDAWTADERPAPYSFVNYIGSAVVKKEPFGVTLIIGAWNYPFLLLFQPMIAAIAAGCAILLKPSELATASEKLISELVAKYLDPDAIICITAGPAEMDFVLRKRFNHIFFTGSTGVAKIIAAAAAKHLTPLTLELGGQGPAVVTAEADIDLAAKRIAATKFINAGQICLNVNHILVDPSVRVQLVERLKHWFGVFLKDDNEIPECYTHIINSRNFDRLDRLLANTKGKVELDGVRDRENLTFGPTIVTGVDINDSTMSEELFGPILPIIDADINEAITTITSMEHALAIYVFTKSKAEKQKIVENTLSGGVTINDCTLHAVAVDAPFGGVGNSGYGAYHGSHGILAFSHQRTVLDPPTWLEFFFGPRYPPYSLTNLNKLSAEHRKPPFGRGENHDTRSMMSMTTRLLVLSGVVMTGGYLFATKLHL